MNQISESRYGIVQGSPWNPDTARGASNYLRIDIPDDCNAVGIFHGAGVTVDMVVSWLNPKTEKNGLVLVKRKVDVKDEGLARIGYRWAGPAVLHGYALPGGFHELGNTLEETAKRETEEETGLSLHDIFLMGQYSDPLRDYGRNNISLAFVGIGEGEGIKIMDPTETDLEGLYHFSTDELPGIWDRILFDHRRILFKWDEIAGDGTLGREGLTSTIRSSRNYRRL